MYTDEELSRDMNLGLLLEGSKQKETASTLNRNDNDVSINFDHDVVDWSDEGEEEDDTPRNHDLLSRLAEESEDDCDEDVLQFSRFTFIILIYLIVCHEYCCTFIPINFNYILLLE